MGWPRLTSVKSSGSVRNGRRSGMAAGPPGPAQATPPDGPVPPAVGPIMIGSRSRGSDLSTENRGLTMSTDLDHPVAFGLRHELEALRGNWLWFIILGIVLIVLGFAVLGYPIVAWLAVELTLGILLVIGGVGEAI